MSCVFEMSDADVDVSIGEDGDRAITPGVAEDIPTFDASDVDQRLQENATGLPIHKLPPFAPLAFVWGALLEAHTQERSPRYPDRQWTDSRVQLQSQAQAIGNYVHNDIDHWDLEAQLPVMEDQIQSIQDAAFREISDLSVRKMLPAIQLVFRRSVLQALALYVAASVVVVVTSLHRVAVPPTLEYVEQSSLPTAVAAASGILVIACMCALYTHRFQAPGNFVTFTLLTLSEIVCAVACGVASNPYAVVVPLALLCCGIFTFCALAGRESFVNNVARPACLVTTTLVVVAAVTAVAIPLYATLGSEVTHTTTPLLTASLVFMSIGVSWITLVLAVIEQTMTPDAHVTAIVFFQVDLFVVAAVVPARLILAFLKTHARPAKNSKSLELVSQRWRKSNPVNHVVPAVWSDDLTPMASIKTCVPAPPTPLFPTQVIRGRMDSSVPSDTRDVVREPKPTINVPLESTFDSGNGFGSPRRRNSISI